MQRHRRGSFLKGRAAIPVKIAAIAIFLIVIVVIVLIPSSSKNSALDSIEVRAIKKKGTLFVAVRDDYTGFSDGKKGLEIEIAKRIAKTIFPDDDASARLSIENIKPSFMDMHFSDSSIDMAIMICPRGLYSSKYSYSIPYYTDSCVIAVPALNASEDLNGKHVGVINDSICQKRMLSYIDDKNANITLDKYPTYEIMLNAMKNGEIGACVMSGIDFVRYEKQYRIAKHNITLANIEYSVVCVAENSELINLVDSVLYDMKDSGELERLIEAYNIGGN